MLEALQGKISGNTVIVDEEDIRPFDGRTVTIIINEPSVKKVAQDKSKFFSAVGKIGIDRDAVDRLRMASMI